MEDSGIDSGDKVKNDITESDDDPEGNLIVTFKGTSTSSTSSPLTTNNNINNNNDLSIAAVKHSCNNDNNNCTTSLTNEDINYGGRKLKIYSNNSTSTCRTLQRKLEMKVERAKRNYNQLYEVNDNKAKSSALIPITRLQIPGCQEIVPLVQYTNDDNSEDDEDLSYLSTSIAGRKTDLSDTFSLQEMTVISDTDESETPSLEFKLPNTTTGNSVVELFLNCFWCTIFNNK